MFQATEMLLYNHKMSAKEALECGFVNYLYKPEELQSKVWDKIEEVSQLPQRSITASKNLLRRTFQNDLKIANELELEALHRVWASEAYQTSVSNFSKKSSKL